MLDQNTDRMWYVIGAVIVGAALIFLMNGTFPELFASVGKTFEEKTEQSTAMTDGIRPIERPKDIVNTDVQVSGYPAKAELVSYIDGVWTLDAYAPTGANAAQQWSAGMSVKEGVIEVPYGATMTIQYDIWSPVATSIKNDVNNMPADKKFWSHPAQNDNDQAETRKQSIWKLPAEQWTTVTMSYANTSPLNVDKKSIFDYSTFGAYNPNSAVPLRIQIKNVSVTVTNP